MVRNTPEGFSRRLRIVRPLEYARIYERGRKVHSASFVLFGLENGLAHPRLGVTVSRRIGGAVVRNGVKRRLREVFRRSAVDLPGHYDLVVNAKRGSATAAYAQLRSEFEAAVDRLHAAGADGAGRSKGAGPEAK